MYLKAATHPDLISFLQMGGIAAGLLVIAILVAALGQGWIAAFVPWPFVFASGAMAWRLKQEWDYDGTLEEDPS